jgi:hypothetical protein
MRAAKVKKSRIKNNAAKKKPNAKAGTAAIARPFRFTAAQTVHIHFMGEKKPETFRVDDMAEATIAAHDGRTRLYFQYRLVSNDKQDRDGSDRCFWFLDPKPVGAPDPIDPSLWRPVSEQEVDGHEVVQSCSGPYSTRSVTGYDGSGHRHVVKLNSKPSYRMRFDFNGKREFCESLPLAIRKGDVLAVP